jgi:hypothetical protein
MVSSLGDVALLVAPGGELDVLEGERLLVESGLPVARYSQAATWAKFVVVALGLAVLGLVLRSRISGMRPSAFLRPASVRAMPQYSHMTWPSSRWKESTVRLPLMPSRRLTRP